jgi:tRNA threonylcarbamoyladenosine biosynthesis protein TsaB
MTILAFDTCFGACSAALWSSARRQVVAERFETMDKGHSERIVPMIDALLAEARLGIRDVGGLAVTIGPGSFTGVRTGLSVARGLALATGLPVHGTTSLHVMAAGLPDRCAGDPVAIAIATRDGFLYFQAFAAADGMPAFTAALLTPSEAAAKLGGTRHLLAGTGAAAIATVAATAGHRLSSGPAEVRAGVLAALAERLPVLSPPEPLYLREPDAKPQSADVTVRLSART